MGVQGVPSGQATPRIGPMTYDFDISKKWPFREPEVGLKWPLGEELGVEVNGVCQGTGGDD